MSAPRCPGCALRALCIVGKQPTAARERLAPLVRERAFRKGETLQQQGFVAQRLRVVKIGLTLAAREGSDGQRRIVALFGRGQTIGGFALLARPEALHCIGASAGRVCEVDIALLRERGLADGRFLIDLADLHVQSFGRLADWALMVRLPNARERLLTALRLLAHEQGSSCVRLPSQSVLAELLGTTRETVARGLRALVLAQDIVRRDRWHCDLLGPLGRDEQALACDGPAPP